MRVLDNIIDLFELAKDRADDLLNVLFIILESAYDVALTASVAIAQTTGIFAGTPEYLLYAGIIFATVLVVLR